MCVHQQQKKTTTAEKKEEKKKKKNPETETGRDLRATAWVCAAWSCLSCISISSSSLSFFSFLSFFFAASAVWVINNNYFWLEIES